MDKKVFGIKLSTYLMFLLCLLAAFLLWIFVNLPEYVEEATSDTASNRVETSHSFIL